MIQGGFMKRILSLTLIIVALFLFAACSTRPINFVLPTQAPSSSSNDVLPTQTQSSSSYEQDYSYPPTSRPTEFAPVQTIKLSDGPVFFYGGSQSFVLTHYSLETGETTELFRFDSRNKYSLAVNPVDEDRNYYARQLFDSNFTRIAVEWFESDSSRHVGWIDKEGIVTDISNKVHPASSGFSGVLPRDSWALFTSDDKLQFYDANQDKYCYYDHKAGKIVDSYQHPQNTIAMFRDGLDLDGYLSAGFLNYLGKRYNTNSGCPANDYAIVENGLVMLYITQKHKGIGQYGADISGSYNDKSGYYVIPEEESILTPETDYYIERLAYNNGKIAFTATRGSERALFVMTYANLRAGEPILVKRIDYSFGTLLCWPDSDSPIL